MSDQRRQFTDQRYVFFVTFSVYRRRQLLDLDQPKRIVLGVLNHLLDSMDAKCVGFVLMPDHVHALVWLPQPTDLTRMLHGWKAQGVDLGLTGDLGLSDTVPVDSMYDEGVIALLAVQVAPSNARPAPNPGHWWRTIKANYTTVDEATVDGALTWLPSQRLRFTAGLG